MEEKSENAKKFINCTVIGAMAGIAFPICIFLTFPKTIIYTNNEFLKANMANNIFAIISMIVIGFTTLALLGVAPYFYKISKKHWGSFCLTLGTAILITVTGYLFLLPQASVDNYYIFFGGCVLGLITSATINITLLINKLTPAKVRFRRII